MKFRIAVAMLLTTALIAAGCGSDSDDSKGSSSKKSDAKQSKAEKAEAEDREVKVDQVERAEKEFKKADDNVGACRNLAMAYISLGSPASASDPKDQVELPKDRDKSLKKAVTTLEGCAKLDPDDRDVKQMLASSYMGTSAYEKAVPLLRSLAGSAPEAERPNAYYALGLAASNAQNYPAAIDAWNRFVELSPSSDARVKQVKQSIKSLQQAQKQKATAPAATATDDAAADDEDKDAAADEDKDAASDEDEG